MCQIMDVVAVTVGHKDDLGFPSLYEGTDVEHPFQFGNGKTCAVSGATSANQCGAVAAF